jgi:hypothetical protein
MIYTTENRKEKISKTETTDSILKKVVRNRDVIPSKLTYFVCVQIYILGAFAKLRKATTSFVMSVCLSIPVEKKTVSHWTNSHEIWYLFFENL